MQPQKVETKTVTTIITRKSPHRQQDRPLEDDVVHRGPGCLATYNEAGTLVNGENTVYRTLGSIHKKSSVLEELLKSTSLCFHRKKCEI